MEGRAAVGDPGRRAAVKPTARYVVFHCADPMEADGTSPYYESIDLDDAYHEQTILAYELNDQAAAGRRTARRCGCASSASSATSTRST